MKKDVFVTYEELRDQYYRICQNMNTESIDDLRKACEYAKNFHWKLLGMLDLMYETEIISGEDEAAESDKLNKMFSSIDLFNAFIDDCGEVMVFKNGGE